MYSYLNMKDNYLVRIFIAWSVNLIVQIVRIRLFSMGTFHFGLEYWNTLYLLNFKLNTWLVRKCLQNSWQHLTIYNTNIWILAIQYYRDQMFEAYLLKSDSQPNSNLVFSMQLQHSHSPKTLTHRTLNINDLIFEKYLYYNVDYSRCLVCKWTRNRASNFTINKSRSGSNRFSDTPSVGGRHICAHVDNNYSVDVNQCHICLHLKWYLLFS